MSQITMSSTYESNSKYIWVKLLWVVHMSQITMSSTNMGSTKSNWLWVVHMSQITMSSTYESNYYG